MGLTTTQRPVLVCLELRLLKQVTRAQTIKTLAEISSAVGNVMAAWQGSKIHMHRQNLENCKLQLRLPKRGAAKGCAYMYPKTETPGLALTTSAAPSLSQGTGGLRGGDQRVRIMLSAHSTINNRLTRVFGEELSRIRDCQLAVTDKAWTHGTIWAGRHSESLKNQSTDRSTCSDGLSSSSSHCQEMCQI